MRCGSGTALSWGERLRKCWVVGKRLERGRAILIRERVHRQVRGVLIDSAEQEH